jgi:hypothetical protein
MRRWSQEMVAATSGNLESPHATLELLAAG